MLKVGKRLLGPILQFSVVAPLGITFEKRDRAFVSPNLHGIVFAPEIGWGGGVQFVDLFLRRAVGRRRQGGARRWDQRSPQIAESRRPAEMAITPLFG